MTNAMDVDVVDGGLVVIKLDTPWKVIKPQQAFGQSELYGLNSLELLSSESIIQALIHFLA